MQAGSSLQGYPQELVGGAIEGCKCWRTLIEGQQNLERRKVGVGFFATKELARKSGRGQMH